MPPLNFTGGAAEAYGGTSESGAIYNFGAPSLAVGSASASTTTDKVILAALIVGLAWYAWRMLKVNK